MNSRVGVLISGNGSTLQSLLDCRDLCDISLVISSSEMAYGIMRAKRAGATVLTLPKDLKGSAQKERAETWITEQFEKYKIDIVILAGFMKIVSPKFITKYKGRIFNIHPSLLPKYKGLNSYDEALKAGDKEAGVTVHHVAEEVDSGEFILQRRFETSSQHLWLHIQEQRVLRESLRKILWHKVM